MDRETHFAEQEVAEVRDRLTRRIDRVSAQLSPLGLLSSFVSELHSAERGVAGQSAEATQPEPGPAREPARPAGAGLKDWVIDNPVAAGLATMAVGALVASVLLGRRSGTEPSKVNETGEAAVPPADSLIQTPVGHIPGEVNASSTTDQPAVR